jgi:hypothetical protein
VMTAAKQEFLAKFTMDDPFVGFTRKESAELWGWNGDLPIFNDLISQMRPTTVVEVGSWLGQSSCTMARSMKTHNLDSVLICVDTWLGSLEHWKSPADRAHLDTKNGRPTIYESFMTNVDREELSGYVVPLPLPSTIACQLLADMPVDMVYLDGSHDYRDVLRDLQDYWPMVRDNGGILFGDDLAWESVSRAVSEFARSIEILPTIVGPHWVFQKGQPS